MPPRSGKPLFELLGDRTSSHTRGAVSGPGPAQTASSRSGAEPRPQTPPREPFAGQVTVGLRSVYFAIAIAGMVCLGAYILGYSIGQDAGRTEMAQATGGPLVFDPERSRVVDPLLAAEMEEDAASAPPPPRDAAEPAGTQTSPTTQARPEPAEGLYPVAGGSLRTDPRQVGTNYAILGDLPRDQAVSAIEFFADQGMRLMGAPLDRAPDGSNDPWFTLSSLDVAVPSGRYRAMERERAAHLRRIADLGRRWQDERRGGSDFGTAYYSKHTGP